MLAAVSVSVLYYGYDDFLLSAARNPNERTDRERKRERVTEYINVRAHSIRCKRLLHVHALRNMCMVGRQATFSSITSTAKATRTNTPSRTNIASVCCSSCICMPCSLHQIHHTFRGNVSNNSISLSFFCFLLHRQIWLYCRQDDFQPIFSSLLSDIHFKYE